MSDRKCGHPKGIPWTDQRKREFYESGLYEMYQERMSMLGKKKTPEQIEKMREAKLGVKKSDEHRAAMSNAHKERFRIFAQLSEQYPNLSKTEIWALIRAMKKESSMKEEMA
jgi:hypothetical protein